MAHYVAGATLTNTEIYTTPRDVTIAIRFGWSLIGQLEPAQVELMSVEACQIETHRKLCL